MKQNGRTLLHGRISYGINTDMSHLYVSDHSIMSEYCAFDTFKAQCFNDEIIMVTHARYGAMKIGKCIETEIGK